MSRNIPINELKEYVDFLSNKEQSGNSYSPDQFNMLVHRGVHDIVRWLFGLVSDYKPGFPVPTISYEVTAKVKDDLRHLKKTEPLLVNTHGLVETIPDDYIHWTRISYVHKKNGKPGCAPIVKNVSVDVITDEDWDDRCNSSLKKPTKTHPVCNFESNSIQFAPIDLGQIKLTYLAHPVKAKWGYYIDEESEVPLYKENESVDVMLPYILLNDLTRIILSYMGINLRESQLIEYSEMIKNKGV